MLCKPIENGKPNEAECITSQQGLIRCMRIINEECNRQIGQELEENVIQQVMATGEADFAICPTPILSGHDALQGKPCQAVHTPLHLL